MAVQESAAQLSMTLKVQEYPTLKNIPAWKPRCARPLHWPQKPHLTAEEPGCCLEWVPSTAWQHGHAS
ncbi:MAEA isoform 17 [Pongo abelii]|uniref:MAEA isoform 17 n=1 Tax=Pongo abelii TaxID=9601 RepID=A0A2J8SS43_PONAB|nr:MAEA isoform 17 [Pongo abelii]